MQVILLLLLSVLFIQLFSKKLSSREGLLPAWDCANAPHGTHLSGKDCWAESAYQICGCCHRKNENKNYILKTPNQQEAYKAFKTMMDTGWTPGPRSNRCCGHSGWPCIPNWIAGAAGGNQ